MAQAGVLKEDDRVELIEGEIVEMAPIGSRHAACVNRLTRIFSQQLGQRALLAVQNPINLGERSEPQPDMALLRPTGDCYATAHPGPEDIFLLIEVADTSVDYDREVKVSLYARSGVTELWLVDLTSARIEVYRSPGPDGYRQTEILGADEHLAPSAFPDVVLPAREILGS